MVEGVLVVVHEIHNSKDLDHIRHDFRDLIYTQIHSHLKNEKCLEVFIINGNAEDVRRLIMDFRSTDDLEYVKFVQS